jgi:hypothetical protein
LIWCFWCINIVSFVFCRSRGTHFLMKNVRARRGLVLVLVPHSFGYVNKLLIGWKKMEQLVPQSYKGGWKMNSKELLSPTRKCTEVGYLPWISFMGPGIRVLMKCYINILDEMLHKHTWLIHSFWTTIHACPITFTHIHSCCITLLLEDCIQGKKYAYKNQLLNPP